MAFDIISFLTKAVALKVSDIHLHVDEYPMLRINGKVTKINMDKITDEDMRQVCLTIYPDNYKDKVDETQDLDFAYEIPNVSRFRVNVCRVFGHLAIVMRVIPFGIKTLAEVKVPSSVEKFTEYNNGLVVVTGATGSGKSTTIAAMIDHININYNKHIITLEDPIEFVYTSKKSAISQRQIHIDTPSFGAGIKYALRQDPDVIFVGEIRDSETISAALNAAETGHLVFATIHTNSAVQTVNRIVNMFPPESREFVRFQLANVLRGTISQKLIPTADGKGRVPACEVLVNSTSVKDYIEKNKLAEIYEIMQGSLTNGMSTLNTALYDLTKAGTITQEIAENYSDNVTELQQLFRGVHR